MTTWKTTDVRGSSTWKGTIKCRSRANTFAHQRLFTPFKSRLVDFMPSLMLYQYLIPRPALDALHRRFSSGNERLSIRRPLHYLIYPLTIVGAFRRQET